MEEVLVQAVAEPRLNSLLLWVFAALALLLSTVGVYGVTSYAVAQRTQELAIRIALGAPRINVFGIVLGEAITVAAFGIAIGLASALLLGRTLASLLYDVAPTDAATLIGGASVVFIAAVSACWRPALRATRVDPMNVLRAE